MSRLRQTLRLLSHEDDLLRTLYRQFDIPTDQYPQRPDELCQLVSTWNELTGRHEAAPDILHYMITKRKSGQWERLGRDAGRKPAPSMVFVSSEDLPHLDAIHEGLQIASDNYAINSHAAKRLQDEFARRTGRILPAEILGAAMITRRKAGALATLRPKPKDEDLGFSDIDEVAS